MCCFVSKQQEAATMSDTKFAPAMFEISGKAMDEVAREFGAMDRDDPKRGPLPSEATARD